MYALETKERMREAVPASLQAVTMTYNFYKDTFLSYLVLLTSLTLLPFLSLSVSIAKMQ